MTLIFYLTTTLNGIFENKSPFGDTVIHIVDPIIMVDEITKIFFTLLILRLTAVCPVALTGSMENLPDGSSSLMLKMELMPVSVSLISMSRLARGVPIGAFSRMLTLYSGLLKEGVSSLTSLIVMVISAVELVSASTPSNR